MGMRSKVIFWIGCSVAEFIMAVTLLIAATKPRGAASGYGSTAGWSVREIRHLSKYSR